MNYFPILIKLAGRRVLVCGSNDEAEFKIRLLLKSSAEIVVFGTPTKKRITQWSEEGLIQYNNRLVEERDCYNIAFAYVTLKKGMERNATLRILTKTKIPYCVVDDKLHSDFITPAIVDRNPVTVAIGSEGTAPALVRHIKAQIENILPQQTGLVARITGAFRPFVYRLSESHVRRHFWTRFFNQVKSQIFSHSSNQDLETKLKTKFTGDVMYDLHLRMRDKVQNDLSIFKNLKIKPGEYFLGTVHRPRNTDDSVRLKDIFMTFLELDKPIVLPLHPRTIKNLMKTDLYEKLVESSHIRLIKPLRYLELLRLLLHACGLFTDSGGMQKEAYFCQCPCITLFHNTSWPETLENGWNTLVDSDKNKILEAAYEKIPKENPKADLFGNGNAGTLIIESILNYHENPRDIYF